MSAVQNLSCHLLSVLIIYSGYYFYTCGTYSYVNGNHREVRVFEKSEVLLEKGTLELNYREDAQPLEAADDAVKPYFVQEQAHSRQETCGLLYHGWKLEQLPLVAMAFVEFHGLIELERRHCDAHLAPVQLGLRGVERSDEGLVGRPNLSHLKKLIVDLEVG